MTSAHERLEARLCAYLGRKHCIVVGRGATAIYLALRALPVRRGKVVLPSILCPSPANVTLYTGFEPIFCDISLADFSMDPASLQQVLSMHDDIVAIMPVHMNGQAAPMAEITALARQRGIRLQLRVHRRRPVGRHVFAHLFAHENAVGADVNHAALFAQPGDQFLNLRIDERLAAADAHHRRVAIHCGGQALLQRHHVLERRGVFADAPAAGAGQVAGVQRFKLQHHRELRCLADFVFNDVSRDFRGQRQWKPHNLFLREQFSRRGRRSDGIPLGWNFVFEKSRQEEIKRGNAFRGANSAASRAERDDGGQARGLKPFPIPFHRRHYRSGARSGNDHFCPVGFHPAFNNAGRGKLRAAIAIEFGRIPARGNERLCRACGACVQRSQSRRP